MIYIGLINGEIKVTGTDLEAVKDGAVALSITLDSIEATDKEIVTAWDGKMYFVGEEPSRPLDDLKLMKREEINKARDKAEQGGFSFAKKTFDSDPVSCQRIACAAQAMAALTHLEPEPIITWTCQDNTTIDLTASQLQELVMALASHSNECHKKATKLKELVEEAQSEEELDKISWDMDLSSNESEEETEETVDGLL